MTQETPKPGLLRQCQIIPTLVPISSPTLWRWVRAGRFPAPVKIGPRAVAWKAEEVHAWLESRKAA